MFKDESSTPSSPQVPLNTFPELDFMCETQLGQEKNKKAIHQAEKSFQD